MYRHFKLEQLADGVWAAIAAEDGSAACNAGIVLLGDRTLVFDTFATVTAAAELRAAATVLTQRSITYVVNSHDHPDHVHGNAIVADGAMLIAAASTRKVMADTGLTKLEGFRRQISQSVQNTEAQLASATTDEERTRLQGELAAGRGFLAGFPAAADYRLPDHTFTDELTIYAPNRTVRLINCGEAHSPCDSVMYLPEEGILFSADLVTEGELVFRYGNPHRWPRVLDRLEGLNPQVIVPGHGEIRPVGTALAEARQYIWELVHTAEAAFARGATEAYADEAPIPVGMAAHWYRDNLRFLLRQLAAAR